MSLNSPVILKPDDLGLILTYQCQNSCRHCIYNCGAERQAWIDPDTLQRAIATIRSEFPGTQVHLTGGEPFLRFPVLLEATRLCQEHGLQCYVETNAGWCTEANLAWDHFSTLKSAGLDAVLISCSPYHAEKIPLWKTLTAIDIAVQIFDAQHVFIYLADWIETIGRLSFSEPVPLENYFLAYGREPARLLLWESFPLIGGGRAGYLLGKYADKYPPQHFKTDSCRMELLFSPHAHLDLFGNYIPSFCGGISLGSWSDWECSRAAYALGAYPDLIEILVHRGPFALFLHAHKQSGFQPLPDGYTDKCHLCVDVRRHLYDKSRRQYQELAPDEFYTAFQDVFNPRLNILPDVEI